MKKRYFFDVHNGSGELKDETGLMLENDDVPREVARIVTDIARDELPVDQQRGIVTIKVRDDSGAAISVGSLTFTYVDLGQSA